MPDGIKNHNYQTEVLQCPFAQLQTGFFITIQHDVLQPID